MIERAIFLTCLVFAAAGCATSGSLYNWGNYEQNLFNYYHKPAVQEAVVVNHLEFLAALEASGKRPAPGLLAEAGTLLLLQGETQKAIEYYRMEHDEWPESRAMMSTLIANLKEDE